MEDRMPDAETERDGTELRRAEEELRERLRYEETVAACSQALLVDKPLDNVLPAVIAHLRATTNVSRVYVFENFDDARDGVCARQLFEVCAPGVAPQIHDPWLQQVPYSLIPRWRETLSHHRAVQGLVATFPPEERAILEPQDIQSLLALPLFVKYDWWGLVGFDDVSEPRVWNERDVRLLQTVAEMIGGYLDRQREAERTARLLADLREERETLDTVNEIGRLLSAELNLDRLVQAATDAATELTGAQFGAFFYNVTNAEGESYLLYTLSGVPREAFSSFPMPRATDLFGPTFRGEGTIRIGDVRRDSRYGLMAPYHGMPPGHLPVCSYLAVPVISRSGEVLGGLFFGHEDPDQFPEKVERNVQALVGQLVVAMDNARLFGESLRAAEEARAATEQARQEIEERKRVEQQLAQSEAHQRNFLRDVLASVTEGKLRLCDSEADLPGRLTPVGEPIPLSERTLHVLRRRAMEAAEVIGLDKESGHDLLTAANEAGMNAIVHAGGGTATVAADGETGVIQISVTDEGGGIEMSSLPRATLQPGYTTAGTLGHGFKLVLSSVDAVWLLTGPQGTTVILEQGRDAPPSGWLRRT